MRTPTEILAVQGRDAGKEARRFLAGLQRKVKRDRQKVFPRYKGDSPDSVRQYAEEFVRRNNLKA